MGKGNPREAECLVEGGRPPNSEGTPRSVPCPPSSVRGSEREREKKKKEKRERFSMNSNQQKVRTHESPEERMQNDRARTLPFFVTLCFASVLQPTVLYRHHPGRPVEHRGYTSSVEQVKPSNKILQRRGFLSERPLLHELLVLLPSQFLLERTSESDGYERGIDHFVRVVETNGKQGSRGGR